MPLLTTLFEWVICLNPLPLNDPFVIPTFFIALEAVSSLLISPLLPPLYPSFSPGSCYKTWVLITSNSSNCLLFFIHLLNQQPPPSHFQKTCRDDCPFYFDNHCLSSEKYSSLFLCSVAAVFTSLALNAYMSSITFGLVQRQPQVWWSPEVKAIGKETRETCCLL